MILFCFPIGILRDYHTGAEFKSKSGLTSDELLTVASIAKSVYMLNSFVLWCEVALQVKMSLKNCNLGIFLLS